MAAGCEFSDIVMPVPTTPEPTVTPPTAAPVEVPIPTAPFFFWPEGFLVNAPRTQTKVGSRRRVQSSGTKSADRRFAK